MLERIPNLTFFSNAYWNQMGDEVYGTIEGAFRQFLDDSSRLPDDGKSLRRELFGELMLIHRDDAYDRWVTTNRTDVETIRSVGGRLIMPEQVQSLMAILDQSFEPDA